MHSCPECGHACYCDMEDHDTGEEDIYFCEHDCDEDDFDED